VNTFPYLGSLITEDGECTTELCTRLNKGQAIRASLQKIWKSHSIPISTKILLLLLLLQNLYSTQIQASSSQRRWRIARWGTWLTEVGKEVSFETAFERANGW